MFILAAQKAPEATGWFSDILRWATGWLVNLIYGAVGVIFRMIFTISEVTAGPDLLGDVYTRIYTILGIFMVFKLSFSFINYILNPDALTDKQQGVGKIIINTVIMLGALAFIPTFVFGSDGIMIRAQKALLPMVPKIVMGIEPGTGAAFNASTDPETLEEYGDAMAAAALSAFFTPIEGGSCDGVDLTTVENFWPNLNETCRIDGVKYYEYRYDGVFALLVGAVMIYVLLGIAIEIGKRVFKLLILQVIAPIPIMTLIDPKGAKGATFSNWLRMTISTFLEVFIKLAVIYFVIMMIGMLTNNTGEGIFGEIDGVLFVFLMIVLLLFAKEAPKFVMNALGMKGAGGDDFFGLKGIGTAIGAGSAIAGGIGSSIGSAATRIANGDGRLRTAAGAVAGAVAGGVGTVGGTALGLLSGNKGKDLVKRQEEANRRMYANAELGSTALGRMNAQMGRAFMGGSYSERKDKAMGLKDDVVKKFGGFEDYLRKEAVTKGKGHASAALSTYYKDSSTGEMVATYGPPAQADFNMGQLKAAMEGSSGNYFEYDGMTYSKAEALSIMNDLEDRAMDNYEADWRSGSISDDQLDILERDYIDARTTAGYKSAPPVNRKDRKSEKINITRDRKSLYSDTKYQASKGNTKAIGGGGKK